jgi:hypothetical protein
LLPALVKIRSDQDGAVSLRSVLDMIRDEASATRFTGRAFAYWAAMRPSPTSFAGTRAVISIAPDRKAANDLYAFIARLPFYGLGFSGLGQTTALKR